MNIGTQDIMINPTLSLYDMYLGTCLGMYSHADTDCVNKKTFIEKNLEVMRVDTFPFDEGIGKLGDLQIINSIYAYYNPNTLHTIILRINHALYIKDTKHALLCQNQYCGYGTIIDNINPHLDHTGTGTFTITAGYYEFPLEQYVPTS